MPGIAHVEPVSQLAPFPLPKDAKLEKTFIGFSAPQSGHTSSLSSALIDRSISNLDSHVLH